MSPKTGADRLLSPASPGPGLEAGPATEPPTSRRSPGALLTHPIALVALGLLLLNDWVLKPSAGFRALGGGAGGWITGKLSDASGLVVGPLLVGAALGWLTARLAPGWYATQRGSRAIAAIAIAVVVVPFVACKLSPAVAAQCAHWLTLFGRPAHIVCDPSDLLVLPFAAIAASLLTRR